MYLPAWHKEEKEHQQPLGNVLFLHNSAHFQKKNGMIIEVILIYVLALESVLLVGLFAFFNFSLETWFFVYFSMVGKPLCWLQTYFGILLMNNELKMCDTCITFRF